MRTCWRGGPCLGQWHAHRPGPGPGQGLEWRATCSVAESLVGFLAGSKKTNAIKAKELELNGVRRGLLEEEEEEQKEKATNDYG